MFSTFSQPNGRWALRRKGNTVGTSADDISTTDAEARRTAKYRVQVYNCKAHDKRQNAYCLFRESKRSYGLALATGHRSFFKAERKTRLSGRKQPSDTTRCANVTPSVEPRPQNPAKPVLCVVGTGSKGANIVGGKVDRKHSFRASKRRWTQRGGEWGSGGLDTRRQALRRTCFRSVLKSFP